MSIQKKNWKKLGDHLLGIFHFLVLFLVETSSNRRPPADIPEDAIVVRGTGEPYFTPPSRNRKRFAYRK